jgi:hypothetical protein
MHARRQSRHGLAALAAIATGALAAVLLAACGSAVTTTTGSAPAATDTRSATPAPTPGDTTSPSSASSAQPAVPTACAEAESSVKGVEFVAQAYSNVRSDQDLVNAATKIAQSSFAGQEVAAPLQSAQASAGENSRLGVELGSVASDFEAFTSITTTAGAPGGASEAEVASDARGILAIIAEISKTCG